jgi:Sec7-like guanine-nucleotide exchange factor
MCKSDFNSETLPVSDSNGACVDRRHTLMFNQSYKETPQQYLERVQYTLSKAELATLLAQHKDVFHEAVLRTYMESFEFKEDPIDLALR